MKRALLSSTVSELKQQPPIQLLRHPEWIIDAGVGALLDPSKAVVVNGFWRSGTTWLQQILCRSMQAKSVFEPLLPHIGLYEKAFKQHYPASDFDSTVRPGGIMPYCRESLSEFPILRSHIQKALTGSLPGYCVRMTRESKEKGKQTGSRIHRLAYRLKEAFCTQVVTKTVRGALILPLIVKEFKPIIVVHIRRDPRAVVSSHKRRNWEWTGWLRKASLEDLLLNVKDGRQSVFARWENEIKAIDEMDYPARMAGYWALTEWYIDHYTEKHHIASIQYERLCAEGASYLNDALSHIGDDIHVKARFLQGESHTSNRSVNEEVDSRIWGWRDEMSPTEISHVESVVDMIGMNDNLID